MYDWIDIHFHKVSARILHFRFLSSSCSWHVCDFVCILPKFLDYTSLLLNKTVCLIWPKRCALKFHAEWWHYHVEIFIFRPCYDRTTLLGFCMFLTVFWMSVQVFLSGVVQPVSGTDVWCRRMHMVPTARPYGPFTLRVLVSGPSNKACIQSHFG